MRSSNDDFIHAPKLVGSVHRVDDCIDGPDVLQGVFLFLVRIQESGNVLRQNFLEKSQMPRIDADNRAGGEIAGMHQPQKGPVPADAGNQPHGFIVGIHDGVASLRHLIGELLTRLVGFRYIVLIDVYFLSIQFLHPIFSFLLSTFLRFPESVHPPVGRRCPAHFLPVLPCSYPRPQFSANRLDPWNPPK